MRNVLTVLVCCSMLIWSSVTYAAFVSGSTGADGAFNPTANTVVTLPPSGVLNYTTVNIPSGVTVTFQKNTANTPVYILATGDVTIAGTINVNGGNATAVDAGKGGPGGGDGGYGGGFYTTGGKGIGPGGGNPGRYSNSNYAGGGGGGGGFGINGINGNTNNWGTGGVSYGSQKLLPFTGGSGGGGGGGESTRGSTGGGGGGGAILIASSTSIAINGSITANGGNGINVNLPGGGGGSGGAIKLVANTISGSGTLTAQGGVPGPWAGYGGSGRIRLEAYTNNRTAGSEPAYSFGSPGSVFVSAQPSLTITSVGGQSAPASPTGNFSQPDITLPSTTTNPVTVNISAANIPVSTTVKVRVIPQYGTDSSVNTTLSGTDQSSTGSASVTLSTTYSNIITAEATFTVVAMYYNGEQIDKVHVAATLGGKSEVTYITKSGKRIKVDQVALAK